MRKSRKPFMVEFSGTPEAGKTTAIRVVANMLEEVGCTTLILNESAENYQKKYQKEYLMQIYGCII